MAHRLPREGRKNATKPAHAVPFGKRPPAPVCGNPGRPFVGARGGGSVEVRNRTGFTARFVPVGRTPTEPNKAEGPVWFLSWVGQAHQLWGEGVPCPTPSQWYGTGEEEERGRGSGRGGKG